MTPPNPATDTHAALHAGIPAAAAWPANGAVVQVVGLGSPHGDDQLGWLVADALARRIESARICGVASRCAGSPAQVLDWLEGSRRLVLVDACTGLTAAGQVVHCRWPAVSFDCLRGGGSHNFTVWQTLELAARLQALPPQIDVWCVEGTQFAAGQPLSEAMSRAVAPTAEAIWQTLIEP
jgi:hydrogenase maturation protease